jgi:solute:Na+ symporter, SSS family
MMLSLFDWVILFAYLALVIGIGVACAGRQVSTDEFFLGGRRFGAFAVSLSVLGSGLSAITFLGIPGYVYGIDWSLLVSGVIAILALIVVARIFVPYFLASPHASAYELLNSRFDTRVASFAAAIFLLMRGLLIGIAIYAPSIALSVVTGWSLSICILVSGGATLIYTTLGGMSAVIWTDIMQVFVLFGGAIAAIYLLCTTVPGTPSDWMATLSAHEKWRIFDFEWSWTRMTFWGGLIGGFVFSVAAYGADQVMVQRYMSSRSMKDARRSLYLNAWYTLPTLLLFFSIGSMLFLYFKANPTALPKDLTNNQVFAYYIVHFMPKGLAGLLIAAIFAGAMSTLSAVLNSLATVSVNDFYKRYFQPNKPDIHYVRVGQGFTLFWGVLAIGTAFFSEFLSPEISMAAIKAAGLFMGPLLGLFLLAMFSRTATAPAVLWGAVIGLTGALIAGFATPLQEFWLTILGAGLTLILSLILSRCQRLQTKAS